MSKPNPGSQGAPIEMLVEWEGPAIPAAGVLMDEGQVAQLTVEPDIPGLAAWIAVTGISGEAGHPVHNALRKKVRGVLAVCRQRFGQAKIDEIKQELFRHMQQYRNQRKMTDEELLQRIERLFDAI